jgi:polyhydroxybutyrate depolymerase
MTKVRPTALAAMAVLAVAACTAPAPPDAAAGSTCAPTLPTGRSTVHLTVGGLDRLVVVYVPEKVERREDRAALVLTLHGSRSDATEQLDRSRLETAADEHGFVVAAPQGVIPGEPGFRWNVPFVTEPIGPDDQQFLLAVIDHLSGAACTDPARVHATGYSGGGRMVSAFACDHADRVASIVPVVGLRAGAPKSDGAGGFVPDPATCAPSRPVRVVTFAGTADAVNPFDGAGEPYWGYGTREAASRWAQLNGCRPEPSSDRVAPNVEKVTYSGCTDGADVTLYVVEGGGHTWPGGTASWPEEFGSVTQEVSVNTVIADLVANRPGV